MENQFNLETLAASLSIVVALLTWLATHIRSLKRDQISYSARLIENISIAKHLADADFTMTQLIKKGEPITESDDNPLPHEIDRQIILLLDYYEYLATMYFTGALHKNTVNHLRGGAMKQAFNLCRGYIEFRQKKIGNYIYNDLQKYASETEIH